jgi:hypothetical protein
LTYNLIVKYQNKNTKKVVWTDTLPGTIEVKCVTNCVPKVVVPVVTPVVTPVVVSVAPVPAVEAVEKPSHTGVIILIILIIIIGAGCVLSMLLQGWPLNLKPDNG